VLPLGPTTQEHALKIRDAADEHADASAGIDIAGATVNV
jgi:hypothetical protein